MPPPAATEERADSNFERFFRRLIDITGACAGLVLASPVIAIAAIFIKAGDGGPVFHRRIVLGLRGRSFHAIKLRTMRPDADAWLEANVELRREFERNVKLDSDPRVTRVGRVLRRTSIDELPQLVNVLIGQMSLVGPRMVHPSEAQRYGEFLDRRLSVRPGLTGLWQVSGRQAVDYDARVRFDRAYLGSRCLMTDLVILMKTVPAVLRGAGAK